MPGGRQAGGSQGRALGWQPGGVLGLADEKRAGINRATPP